MPSGETPSKVKENFNEKELKKNTRKNNIVGKLQTLKKSKAISILKDRDVDSFRVKITPKRKAQVRDNLNGVFEEEVQYQVVYGYTYQWQYKPC